tara:strand:+ start:1013 stop:2620 length:1608 start_codon:yes stop_codon:yes gene_type:complete
MKNFTKKTLNDCLENLDFPSVDFSLQIPKNIEHGDLATNIAFLLSKKINKNPLDVAEILKKELDKSNSFSEVMIAKPGFINLKLSTKIVVKRLEKILIENETYGSNKKGSNKKVQIEFVSANPTGPLTVGHGRGAILGDCLSNIFIWNGYEVDREYYYNNAGRQMRVLAESVLARYSQISDANFQFPEEGYKGEYIRNIANKIYQKHGDKLSADLDIFKDFAEEYIFKEINKALINLGIKFDSFFNEKTLYENNNIYQIIDLLKNKKLIYEKDGATWFEGTKVGRNADRVLIKKTGEPTYRLPDIAYHKTKFDRNYDIIVDVFGADHMDAYPDVLEALNQIGYDVNKIKVMIHQFVTILENGEPIKMSTREANFITLNELIKEVGSDAVRYFFIMRSMNSHLNFDLKIAKEKNENNPVFYIQYAHARICTILSKAPKFDGKANLELLNSKEEIKLIFNLIEFENIVTKIANSLEPQLLANYLHELASLFHKYYAHNRIILDNQELCYARIVLIKSIKIVIFNGLKILGISCPEKM